MKNKIALLLSCLLISSAFAGPPPSIYVIGTGGNIAVTATGKLKTEELIKQIPEDKRLSNIKTIDLFQIDSNDITIQNWLTLTKEIEKLLSKPEVKGIVVTHGTDTLEETAYFLNLVLKNKKPVILVGAMRPHSSFSADGLMNLYNALAVADTRASIGKGVVVVMNENIYDARDVTMTNASQLDTFKSPNSGPIGDVKSGKPRYFKTALNRNTEDTPFDVVKMNSLPKVDIVYEYAGSQGDLLKSAIDNGAKGIVIAGLGDGNITEPERKLLKLARDKGIMIVRSSRTGSGSVTTLPIDNELGLIAANNLNPQKSRILLMLALTKTDKPEVVRQYFDLY